MSPARRAIPARPRAGRIAAIASVALAALQPYLPKAADAGMRAGSLELELASTVERGRLRAPGLLTLSGLELAPASGSFLGLPREAVLALLRNRAGRIELDFVLDGAGQRAIDAATGALRGLLGR